MSLVTQVSDLATRTGTEIKTVRTEITALVGSLAALTTTDKSSVIAAINEVQAEVGAANGSTNLAATLSPTQTVITSDTGNDATIPAANATNAGVMSKALYDKLTAIEALADVTDSANVDAAGAVMNTDTSTAAMGFVVDEDDMVSNSATKIPTQQSVAAYVSQRVNALVDSAPGTLDTLNELAAALGDDPNAITSINTALGNRLRVDTAAQGLTGTQQSNGRTNLDVYSTAEIGNPETDFVAVFETALT